LFCLILIKYILITAQVKNAKKIQKNNVKFEKSENKVCAPKSGTSKKGVHHMKTILFAILILSVLSAQDTKTLTLKSGDKITGQVVSETETTITIINPLMGEMTLNKSDLKEETISITLKSGDVVKGIVLEKTPSYFKLQSAFGEITIPTEDIETIGNIKKAAEKASLTPKQTLFGTRWEQNGGAESDEWYFSKERLMDIWFDPTGFTIEKNKLYLSGLSWGFGLSEKVQITSKWTNYFYQDFNLRPKINLFKTGDVESQSSMAAGFHLHTRGLPGKYKWVPDKETWWNYNNEYNSETGNWENTDSTYYEDPGWVHIGSKREQSEYDDDHYEYTGPWDGNKMWYEVFGAYTISKLRSGGNGRVNTTIGGSATFYPDEETMPRIFAAIDIDVTQDVKVMGEIFYDAFFPETINMMNGTKMQTPIHFDIGFLTNKLALDENMWFGFHFQRPYVSFYWKF